MRETKKFFNDDRLNKGYSDNSAYRESDEAFYGKNFAEILPPVEVMAEYENISPGILSKLTNIAEREQSHRHKLDFANIESDRRAAKIGSIFAFSSVFLICLTSLSLAFFGVDPWAAFFPIASFSIIGIISFVRSLIGKKRHHFRKPEHFRRGGFEKR